MSRGLGFVYWPKDVVSIVKEATGFTEPVNGGDYHLAEVLG